MFTPVHFPSVCIECRERSNILESTLLSSDSISPSSAPSLSASLRKMRNIYAPRIGLQDANIQIFSDTLKYIHEHRLSPFQIKLYLRDSSSLESSSFEFSEPTKIWVINTTTFQIIKTLLEQGLKPLVLDMANRSSPGGSVLEGSPAQEETLCRQSNLYQGLKQAQVNGYYPIPECGGILIKNVTFFRDDNYNFLAHAFQVDMFASAAYDCNLAHKPDLEKNLSGYDRPDTEAEYEEGTKTKIRIMLKAAKANGNDSLILSAFGCGAFKNDPIQMSIWYKEVLNEPDFQNAFKVVAFAIQDIGQGNFQVFKKTFE